MQSLLYLPRSSLSLTHTCLGPSMQERRRETEKKAKTIPSSTLIKVA